MKEIVRLEAKAYSYLKYSNNEDKQAKGTKECVIKRKNKFQDYKNCLEVAKVENKVNHLEKTKIDVDGLKKGKKNSYKIIS